MKADYIIRVGEPLKLSLIVTEGDSTTVQNVEAILKLAGVNLSVPSINTPAVASFTVSEAESPYNGWDLYIDEDFTLTLKPGFYVTNAKLTLISGEILKTEPVFIEIKASVT